jgi:HEPN domain-containing protein
LTPRERALELLELAREDELAAHVLVENLGIGDAIVGFHYQQATEKLLKALLADRDIDYPYTHDLVRLLTLTEQAGYTVPIEPPKLARLTPFAAVLRYQTAPANVSLSRDEVRVLIQRLREWVVQALGTERE